MTAINDKLTAALRAVLPLAQRHATQLRTIANAAQEVAGDHVTDRAEAATSAVTAARLALQDAQAAAHHVNCHVRYRVTFQHVRIIGTTWRAAKTGHAIEVMAECADDAQAAALAVCEAAALIHGDVLRVERVTA